jgi:hypothetical protein
MMVAMCSRANSRRSSTRFSLSGNASTRGAGPHAAARGLPITKLVLLEPPLDLDDEPSKSSESSAEPEPDLRAEVAELVAAGRRGDAVEPFNASIGVPLEMVAGMREAPYWPALEALAHTLIYDMEITSSLGADALAGVTTPTLVINSDWQRRAARRVGARGRGCAAGRAAPQPPGRVARRPCRGPRPGADGVLQSPFTLSICRSVWSIVTSRFGYAVRATAKIRRNGNQVVPSGRCG